MPDHRLANDVPTESFPVTPPAPLRIPTQRTGGWSPPAPPAWPAPATPAPRRRRRWPWIVLGVLAVLVALTAINGRGNPTGTPAGRTAAPAAAVPSAAAPAVSAPAVTPTVPSATPAVVIAPAVAPQPVGPDTTMGDGTYEVGVDIAAGRYKTAGPNRSAVFPYCYWERSKDDSGEFGSIISNDNIGGPGSVTVKKGEFVKLSGGCTWTRQ